MINLIAVSQAVETGGIIAVAGGILTAIYAGVKKVLAFILKYKSKAFAAMQLVTESVELIEAFDLAIADKRISKEELQGLRDQFAVVKEAYNKIKESE